MTPLRFLTLASTLVLALALSACDNSNLSEPTAELETTAFGNFNRLERFFNPSGNHFHNLQPLGTAREATDATFEGTLGLVRTYASDRGGRVKVYDCKAGDDDFTSLRSDCEGQTRGNPDDDFYLHDSDGENRAALYRCNVNGGGDHFLSLSSDCEGQTNEGVLGYINTRKEVKQGVIKTSLGTFEATTNPPKEFETPPWVESPPGASGEGPNYGVGGFLIPEQDFTGYDGYEARCNGIFYSKKRIVWQNVTTDTTVASSSRRLDGRGQLKSDIGPTQDVQATQNYRLAIYPSGLINPPNSNVYQCEIFGLDFR